MKFRQIIAGSSAVEVLTTAMLKQLQGNAWSSIKEYTTFSQCDAVFRIEAHHKNGLQRNSRGAHWPANMHESPYRDAW